MSYGEKGSIWGFATAMFQLISILIILWMIHDLNKQTIEIREAIKSINVQVESNK